MAPRRQAQAITLPPVGVHTGAQVLAFVGTNPTDRPLSFADSQQGRRRYATGGLALAPYVPRERMAGRARQRWVSDQQRSGTPWSDRGQAYALAGTLSHLFSRVSRGFDRWAGSGGRALGFMTVSVTEVTDRMTGLPDYACQGNLGDPP